MNLEKAKQAYLDECQKIGKVPQHVTYMTYDQYSEKYTLGNESDGDFVDMYPNGSVTAMHWNLKNDNS